VVALEMNWRKMRKMSHGNDGDGGDSVEDFPLVVLVGSGCCSLNYGNCSTSVNVNVNVNVSWYCDAEFDGDLRSAIVSENEADGVVAEQAVVVVVVVVVVGAALVTENVVAVAAVVDDAVDDDDGAVVAVRLFVAATATA
jgi:hypothetical protein